MQLPIITKSVVEIEVPDYVFDPMDPWGVTFREAAATIDFSNKVVLEAGCGSGALALQILHQSVPQKLYVNDLTERVMAITCKNISRHFPNFSVEYCVGDICDVLANWDGEPLDYILGCLPQVPARGDDLMVGQVAAHEYDDRRHRLFLGWGLGLLCDLKVAAKNALAPGGSVILVHSGRVPFSVRAAMDEATGYREVRIVHQQMVRHHSGTPLKYLFGHKEPVLYRDPHGNVPLSPEEAEKLRLAFVAGEIPEKDYQVYHSVLVVESEPLPLG